jgi:hypothetical protein
MRGALLAGDILLLVLGIVVLLYAYRVIGKPPGADERYDAAMARKGVISKVLGWCVVGAGVLGLVGYLTAAPW